MGRKIQIKRGLEQYLPTLELAELGFTTDTKKLIIGGINGNIDIAGEGANVLSASKLTTPRIISLSGGATGSVSFDGSGNVNIEATVVNDSHGHVIGNVGGLEDNLTDLDGRLDTTETEIDTLQTAASTAVTHIGTANIHVKITSGTAAPTGGADGDVYFQYE